MILESFLSFAVPLCWNVVTADVTHGGRHKRILNGRETSRNSGYTSSRYIVWITHTTFCANFFPSWDNEALSVMCDVDPKKLRCGGALLTPKIVQTACHCIADKGAPRPKNTLSPYVRIIPAERRFYVFAGWAKVGEMTTGYGGENYVINEQCANLNVRNLTGGESFPVIYDYGLIILKSRVEPYPTFYRDATNYAPYYRIQHIESMWSRMVSTELTCLFVGFGLGSRGSKELNHGWGIVRNYLECFRLVEVPLKLEHFNYVEDATWVCSTPLALHSDRLVRGDSGSPVTCDNEYVGVYSQTVSDTAGKVDLSGPLVFTIFENSKEYRPTLHKIEETFPPPVLVSIPRPPMTRQPPPVVEEFSLKSTTHSSPIALNALVWLIVYKNTIRCLFQ